MTKIVSISEAQIHLHGLLASARDTGDEIVLEENGVPIAKITPIKDIKDTQPKPRVFGLGKGKTWMSEDFDDELPDEFWGFDKVL